VLKKIKKSFQYLELPLLRKRGLDNYDGRPPFQMIIDVTFS
jgi:hypothetical protein